jgi:hypothetical protein
MMVKTSKNAKFHSTQEKFKISGTDLIAMTIFKLWASMHLESKWRIRWELDSDIT